jgi:hypothetical protein
VGSCEHGNVPLSAIKYEEFIDQLSYYQHLSQLQYKLVNHPKTEFLVNNIYNQVRTSQETHYVSATKPNRLMLFRETVAVYCENHTEHTDSIRSGQVTTDGQSVEPQMGLMTRY